MSEPLAINPTHDLFFHALRGDVTGILTALDAGADPNASTPSINAVTIVIFVREGIPLEPQRRAWKSMMHKCDPEYQRTRTPLLLAAEFDHYEAVLALLERGANPNFADEDGITPLWAAAQRQQTNIARVLLRAGANVNAEDCEGQTPLFRAVEKGSLEIVRLLLAAGADANRVTAMGITPLLVAARRGQEIMFRTEELGKRCRGLLSNQSGDISSEMKKLSARKEFSTSSYGAELRTLLRKQIPAPGDYPAIVVELVAHGADVNYVFSDTSPVHRGTTALHEAAVLGCEPTVRFLLEHWAEINAGDGQKGVPLADAAYSGNLDLVQLLLSRGAKINGANKDGWTALISAACFGETEIMRLLMDEGTDVIADGARAVEAAAGSNEAEAIRLLVANGVGVDSRGDRQRTPLMVAVKSGAVEAVQALLDAGADIHARDDAGKTAWDWAQVDSLAKQMQVRMKAMWAKSVKEASDSLPAMSPSAADFAKRSTERIQNTLAEMKTDISYTTKIETDQEWEQRAAEGEAKRAAILELLRAAGTESA